ncbi:alpha/beta fold hydrolase [Micromonospora sp. NPDC000207]|uniref:alpha/beta fold hydrolase n=1 Tax=Micromonospora sp. NPDC000207 TaxID=3154246 RepID=UPI00331BF947
MDPTDPTRLAHHRCGDGPPLVLIHGLGSHWQVWRPVVADLARHRDVIALDLPGFGATPPWPPHPGPHPTPGSVPHLADRVAVFLDSLGLGRVEVAGNSLGGGIALELARRGRPAGLRPTDDRELLTARQQQVRVYPCRRLDSPTTPRPGTSPSTPTSPTWPAPSSPGRSCRTPHG